MARCPQRVDEHPPTYAKATTVRSRPERALRREAALGRESSDARWDGTAGILFPLSSTMDFAWRSNPESVPLQSLQIGCSIH